MTINNPISKTGHPEIYYSDVLPTSYPKLSGQIVIDESATINLQDNSGWVSLYNKNSLKNSIYYGSDFIVPYPFQTFTSGTGSSATYIDDVGGRPGILRLNTGTTATGNARVSFAGSNYSLANNTKWWFDASIRFQSLSDATNTFIFGFGFATSTPIAAHQAIFVYRHDLNGGKFAMSTRRASGTTIYSDTGITVGINTWYRLSALISEDASNVGFYVNGNFIGNSTTNIPNSTSHPLNFGIWLAKSVGNTAVTMDIDYMELAGYSNNSINR